MSFDVDISIKLTSRSRDGPKLEKRGEPKSSGLAETCIKIAYATAARLLPEVAAAVGALMHR